MNNSVNSSSDNLADIVGMQSVIDANVGSPLLIAIITVCISLLLIVAYIWITHGVKSQLRQIKHQLNKSLISPREAAHKIAHLELKTSLNNAQINQLTLFRFAPKSPRAHQIIEFINHVG